MTQCPSAGWTVAKLLVTIFISTVTHCTNYLRILTRHSSRRVKIDQEVLLEKKKSKKIYLSAKNQTEPYRYDGFVWPDSKRGYALAIGVGSLMKKENAGSVPVGVCARV